MTEIFKKAGIELRLGDYREVLQGVEPDAVITDPPYSERVHAGQRTGSETAKATIGYTAISEDWASEFAEFWSLSTQHWAIVMSDHLGAWWHEQSWERAGWYVFAPVIHHRANATPRVAGDGPTSAVDYITVARPRRRLAPGRSGSRPGHYSSIQSASTVAIPGGKSLDLMRAIVRDYSRPGDLVCDPCAGGATTLIAAALEGRRAIGADLDPETYRKACARIERTALTAPLFIDEPRRAPMQSGLRWDDPTSEVG